LALRRVWGAKAARRSKLSVRAAAAMAETRCSEDQTTAEDIVLGAQAQGAVRSMVPMCILMLALVVAPCFPAGARVSHLQEPAAYMGSLAFACMTFAVLVGRSSDASHERNATVMSFATLGMRLAVHVVTIVFDRDSHTFLKSVAFCLPVSAAKSCSSPALFRAFLVLHNLLVWVRFWGDLERGATWIVVTVLVSVLSHDNVQQAALQRDLRTELASAYIELERVSEATTRDIFERLCDASAVVSADGSLSEFSPQLPSLLGKVASSLPGRLFGSLLHRDEPPESGSFSAATEPGRVQHRQVRLADAYGQPVPVHVLHATFVRLDRGPTTILGISETWTPPKAKCAGEGARSRLDGDESPKASRESSRSRARRAEWEGRAAGGPSASSRSRDADLERLWAGVAKAAGAACHTRASSRAHSQPCPREGEDPAPVRRRAAVTPPAAAPLSRPEASRSEASRTGRPRRRGDAQFVPQAA